MKNERNCLYCGAKQNITKGKATRITAIIRTRDVCNLCFDIFKNDNQRRLKKRISIPNSFARLKEK